MLYYPNNLLTIITTFCLFLLSRNIKIPCQYVNNNWSTNLKVQLNSREQLVSTRYNFDMIIDAQDETVSKSINDMGIWNVGQIHVIAHFLKPGSKVLNLGSQTGLQAIFIGKLVGPAGRLYIAQPYSVSYSIVKKNIYLNDLEDITVLYRVGASDVQAEQKMVISTQNTGAAQIYDFAHYPSNLKNRPYVTEIVRVDLMDNVIPKDVNFDFMLIDVEKMEIETLLGMRGIIERSKNVVIYLQWQYIDNPDHNQKKALRCLNHLKDLHFNFYRYQPNTLNKCQVGVFIKIELQKLLSINSTDIIIAPQHIDPNTL